MESDNKFENDTGGMSVDEIIADIDRKTANGGRLKKLGRRYAGGGK